jgi:hypothetical protein
VIKLLSSKAGITGISTHCTNLAFLSDNNSNGVGAGLDDLAGTVELIILTPEGHTLRSGRPSIEYAGHIAESRNS